MDAELDADASGMDASDAAPACPDGGTSCNGSCVDTTSSAGNCGTCGRDCTFGTDAGATCNQGACTGFAIANEPYNGSSNHDGCTLYGAIDTRASDSYLYFASEDRLYTVLKSGGAASGRRLHERPEQPLRHRSRAALHGARLLDGRIGGLARPRGHRLHLGNAGAERHARRPRSALPGERGRW
jgi:hypothetical protein